jgi:RNA polymerase sigma-70 factor (ECF subfamily)
LARADRGRGRFRAFLLSSLNHFAANELRADMAGKRAPRNGRPVLSLDADNAPDPPAGGPARDGCDAFDVAWAREALAEALRRMRADCAADGRPDLWDVFDARVLAPAFEDADPTAPGDLARRHGYRSEKAAGNALVTAKRRFEQVLRSVLAEHAADEDDLDDELADLRAALVNAPRLPPAPSTGRRGPARSARAERAQTDGRGRLG